MAAQNTYDTRGLLVTATMAQAVTSAPENLASGVSWANHTTYGYDHQGRTSSETLHTASPASTWTTTYSHDRVGVTTDAPGPGLSRNTYDAFGRLASVAEHNGSVWDTTSYTYQATGELASITDAAGNAITYIYDRLGRRTGMADPDAGSWQYSYDLVGNQTRVVDADPATPDLHLIYDNLNRLVERRSGSVSGPVLAEWDYDAAGGEGAVGSQCPSRPGPG